LVSNSLYHAGNYFLLRTSTVGDENKEAYGCLTLEAVRRTHHGTLGHLRMRDDNL
jgi:hypothetical protein